MPEQSSETGKTPQKIVAPFGTWPSMITPDMIVSDSITIDEPRLSKDAVYYIERRPQESGRCVIVKVAMPPDLQTIEPGSDSHREDILPEPYSARSRAHEYGGGSYCIGIGDIYFVNDSDQDIYCITEGGISRLTQEHDCRFADFVYDSKRRRLISVCEKHLKGKVINSLVSIDTGSGTITTIVEGSDFYASPRLSGAADQLCWQSWNHPDMPWDGNELWTCQLDEDGRPHQQVLIAGGKDISIFQPRWSPDDILYYVSDESGWWHLYRQPDTPESTRAEQLTDGEREFGLPQWVFAQSSYTFIDRDTIICSFQSGGRSRLAKLNLNGIPRLTELKTSWNEFHALSSCPAEHDSICLITASDHSFPQLVIASLGDAEEAALHVKTIRETCNIQIASDDLSLAQTIVFKNRRGQQVYANYYPPTSADYQAPVEDRPPLIVICHGGPTGQSGISLDPKKQFWTSRGFALLDVNYSGSTGYGRDYRDRLDGRWGQLDVEDCCDAAEHAVTEGLADRDRLIIRGSSAGGYTVLSALTFYDVFDAGASYYGISELCSLAEDTHKFESRYLDRLIGPYPEDKVIYQKRSPINYSEKLNCPVIFFQGIEDAVVPKSQSENMYAALEANGVTVAAQYFQGEQHGFRKAGTITQSLKNELAFYQTVFRMKPTAETHFTGEIKISNT